MKALATRSIAALAIVAALGVSGSVAAYADGGTTTTVHGTMPARHLDRQAYLAAQAAIGRAFSSSITSAKDVYRSAMIEATTSAERNTARAALKLAIVQASAFRGVSLMELGRPPAKP
jgi:hypothetical protein